MILWIWCPTLGSIKDEISAWRLTEDTAPVRSCMPKAQILGATSDLDHCGKLPQKKTLECCWGKVRILEKGHHQRLEKDGIPPHKRFGPEMVDFIP